MPAKSAAQQKAAGAALSAKRGDTPKSKLKGASKQMEESMTEKQLEDFAHTKRKGKPETLKCSHSNFGAVSPSVSASSRTWLRISPAAHSQPALQAPTTTITAISSHANFRKVRSPISAPRFRGARRTCCAARTVSVRT